jgi:hypothetical protein
MATIGNTYYNLADYFRSMSPDGSIEADILEILSIYTPLIQDAVTIEANNGTSHIHTVRDTLPSVTWGRLYQGVAPSKSGRSQVTDTTGFVEGLSTIDKRLLELAGDKAAAIRLSEARGFLQSMAIEAEQTVFYGDTITTPEEFKGLAARANAIGSGTYGNQIIDGGGSGSDNTSIWFVTWSEDCTALIHPQNTPAGLSREDMGTQRVLDANSKAYYAVEEMFRWHLGLSVKDPRGNVRIANIDVSDLLAGNVDLYALMASAYYRLGNTYTRSGARYTDANGAAIPGAASMGRTVIYMNRTVMQALDMISNASIGTNSNLYLTTADLEGKMVQTWRGLPIRLTDSLLNTEASVA